MTHAWMPGRVILWLMMVMAVMGLLTMMLLLIVLGVLVAHAHLHVSLMAWGAIHHHMLTLLVSLAEHDVGILSALRYRRT